MFESRFSAWQHWARRSELKGGECPGVYALALTNLDIARRPFSWRKEIIYVGMTVAVGGLKSRLAQFDNTVGGKRLQHGGADRVRYRHRSYKRLVQQLYVAFAPTTCDPSTNLPGDLRKMGTVVRLEYLCLAEYAEKFGKLPEFNDKKRSPKYSWLASP